MSAATTTNVKKEIAPLERMTVGQLRQRYAEVFGEPARSNNRQWLLRRVAWRLQALAEGDLAARAIERARVRARELAREADLRLRPPAEPITTTVLNGTAEGPMPIARDERIPPAGTVLARRFKGQDYRVAILAGGFESNAYTCHPGCQGCSNAIIGRLDGST